VASPLLHSSETLVLLAQRLQERAITYERKRDSRCVFTLAYAMMTRSIAAELPKAGSADIAWIVQLAEAFSIRYFSALDARDRHEAEAPAWKTVFDALERRRTSTLEDLVFAMTAHIVHDLPLALSDISPASGPVEAHIYDFHAVNEMMGHTIDPIQEEIARRYSPYTRWLDRLAEGYDEILTNYGVRMSRGLAWYNAIRLSDPRSRADAEDAINRSAECVVAQVLNPPIWSLRVLLRIGRLIARLGRRWPADTPVIEKVARRE
jgi:hypothetical protein